MTSYFIANFQELDQSLQDQLRTWLVVAKTFPESKTFVLVVKEALDNFSLIPIFFPKKIDIFIPLEGYTYVMNVCSFLLVTSIQLQQRYKDFSFSGHFKKSTSENTNTVANGTLWGWC